jgi:predicted transposase YbfD/YdcC
MTLTGDARSGRTLWQALGEIPDRRGRKGRQYPLRAVIGLALAAMLAGADDLMAIFRWGRRLPSEALGLLGLTQAPCHATYHYFFKALDVVAADQVLAVWARGDASVGHIAIDGKRLRGSAAAGHDGSAGVHLVAAFASRLGAVIGQLRVAPGANEITAALALLTSLPLEGAIVTGDAAFCQRAICQSIRDQGGDYLFTIKANQPRLMADIAVAFGDAFPPELTAALGGQEQTGKTAWDGLPADLQTTRTVEKGHGRIETRELAATGELSRYLDWPGAAQVCRIERRREIGTKCSQETVYAITSLPRERASAANLLTLNRQHWAIENRLHWRRDTAFAEDRSPIRSNNAPQALASLRNTVLRLVHPFRTPTRATRQIFAENRFEAIKLVVQPLL